jgi:hypothetical protein
MTKASKRKRQSTVPAAKGSKVREMVRIRMDHWNMELEDIMTKRENNVHGHKGKSTTLILTLKINS